jgi:hypothetical protein
MINARRAAIYVVAVALGAAIAIPHERNDAKTATAGPQGVRPVSSTPASGPRPALQASERAAQTESGPKFEPRIYAAVGVAFEAFRTAGAFVGYSVVRSHDPRLAVGDVVTAVNGDPVEDSAAGGEMLTAALRNPQVELSVRPRTDWASTD